MNYNNILAEIINGKSEWPAVKSELSKYNVHDLNLGEKDTRAGKLFEYFAKYYFQHAPLKKGTLIMSGFLTKFHLRLDKNSILVTQTMG